MNPDDANSASIIEALSKLDIYMRRDAVALSTLSPQGRLDRLQRAFDQTIESCCFYPVLFKSREYEMGKLILSSRAKWIDGGKPPTKADLKDFTHTIWPPIRMGRYSFTDNSQVKGASIRRVEDVPEIETLIMRLMLSTAFIIAIQPTQGFYWSLTSIPAKNNDDTSALPLPQPNDAVLAYKVIDVVQMNLPDDIPMNYDMLNRDETELAAAGYKGNKNVHAIPFVIVRYATTFTNISSRKDMNTFITATQLQPPGRAISHITPTQHNIFSRLLESNSRRLAPSEHKKYQMGVSEKLRSSTKISFFSPIFPPSSRAYDLIEIGRKRHIACSVCLMEQTDADRMKYCSSCTGVVYCSQEHQREHWPIHKADCRTKKNHGFKLPRVLSHTLPNNALAIYGVVLQLCFTMGSNKEEGGKKDFFICPNPMDMRAKSEHSGYSKTIYGPDERFLVRVHWGAHADRMFGVTAQQRRTWKFDLPMQPGQDELLHFTFNQHMGVLHILDRAGTFSVLFQRPSKNIVNPLVKTLEERVDSAIGFDTIVKIIKKLEINKFECGYFWALRRGDCIQLDLLDIPDQRIGW